MTHCLDSDFLVEVFSGNETAAALLAELVRDGPPSICAVTAFEVTNIRAGRRRDAAIEALSTLEIVQVDGSAAIAASHLAQVLRRSGRDLPMADLLIAATCLLRGMTLVSRNAKHFGRIPGLKTVAW